MTVAVVLMAGCGQVTDAEKPHAAEPAADPAAEPAAETEKPQAPKLTLKPDSKPALKPAPKPAPKLVAGPDKVLVTVNGEKIFNSEADKQVDMQVKRQFANMGAMAQSLPAGTIESMKDRIRPQVVQMLVEVRLVTQKLKAKKLSITDAEIESGIAKILKQNKITMDDMKKNLAQDGITLEDFKKQLKTKVGLEKLLKAEMKGKVALAGMVTARKFYDENPANFAQPGQVRASHILVDTRKMDEAGKVDAKAEAQDLLKKAQAEGADFAELAKANSDCPSSKDGGDLNFFSKEKMVPEFSKAAFAMKVGQISDLVETQFGYHIIKVTDRKEALVSTFEEEKEKIIKFLDRKNIGQFWQKYRPQLKADAKIEYSDEIKAAMDAQARQMQKRPPSRTAGPKGKE